MNEFAMSGAFLWCVEKDKKELPPGHMVWYEVNNYHHY
jgi:quercetin dioxygenase-like cupin family protein